MNIDEKIINQQVKMHNLIEDEILILNKLYKNAGYKNYTEKTIRHMRKYTSNILEGYYTVLKYSNKIPA